MSTGYTDVGPLTRLLQLKPIDFPDIGFSVHRQLLGGSHPYSLYVGFPTVAVGSC